MLRKLPASLCRLYASDNYFEGAVDFGELPRGLEMLDLRNNEMCGVLAFEEMPAGMKFCDLRENNFFPLGDGRKPAAVIL